MSTNTCAETDEWMAQKYLSTKKKIAILFRNSVSLSLNHANRVGTTIRFSEHASSTFFCLFTNQTKKITKFQAKTFEIVLVTNSLILSKMHDGTILWSSAFYLRLSFQPLLHSECICVIRKNAKWMKKNVAKIVYFCLFEAHVKCRALCICIRMHMYNRSEMDVYEMCAVEHVIYPFMSIIVSSRDITNAIRLFKVICIIKLK